jgi:leucyl/phenylalanyl-tRNA--protein transferase
VSASKALESDNDDCVFPPVDQALSDPNGLLAVGGRLTPRCLLRAYRGGIFPWYSEGQPLLWWSPDPRMVLYPEELRITRSLRKTLGHNSFLITFDQAFDRVITACASQRRDDDGTWITADMIAAYCRLHEMGYAHSVEAWCGEELVGGLYGIAIGQVFFGESMFHRFRDASKVALVHLVRRLIAAGFRLIDCQVASAHLVSLGATEISRQRFIRELDRWCGDQPEASPWSDTANGSDLG